MRKSVRLLAVVLTGLTGGLALAEPHGPTAAETAMLPPYCGGPGGAGVDWRAKLGEAMGWNNHTCYGINRINRYFRTSNPAQRRNHLQIALQDFNYSVSKLPADFPLMQEIHYYRGLVFKLQGQPARAMADWQRSISLDRHYVKSIVALADLLATELKRPAQALALVTEGLRDNPGSRALQTRYTRLGGKPPFPEPRVPPAAAAPATPAAPAAASAPAGSAPPASAAPVAASPAQPVIGMPGNPWCRFCPVPAPSADPPPSTPAAAPTAGP